MPHKILALPERFIITAHYDVLCTDVNSANQLGAERLLSIAQVQA